MKLHVAAEGAADTNARGPLQVPGPGFEPVLAAGQRADRAELNRVAAKRRVEGVAVKDADLAVAAAIHGRQCLVAGNLGLETGAAVAHDAPLAVQHDPVGQDERLVLLALLFREAAGSEP